MRSIRQAAALVELVSQSEQSVDMVREEGRLLADFALQQQEERLFQAPVYEQLVKVLASQRLCNADWIKTAAPEHLFRLLTVTRLLSRAAALRRLLSAPACLSALADLVWSNARTYISESRRRFLVDALSEVVTIVQRLAVDDGMATKLVALKVQDPLVLLLSASDMNILHAAMATLLRLCKSSDIARTAIGELNCVEALLRILKDYYESSKCLGAELLRVLCFNSNCREQMKMFNGIPILLNLLHTSNIKLLISVTGCLENVAKNYAEDICSHGGIPLVVSLLSSTVDAQPASATASAALETQLLLHTALCSLLAQLCTLDLNALRIREADGVHKVALLILPCPELAKEKQALLHTRQIHAFRALRYLFALEQNRRLFKRLFPPVLFEMFICAQQPGRDMWEPSLYVPMAECVNAMKDRDLHALRTAIAETSISVEPTTYVREYGILEKLGEGSFGSVYRVQKQNSFFAMKQIHVGSSMFGETQAEQSSSLSTIMNEIAAIESNLNHPNIVRYYKSFTENDLLYIVMELVEGATLQDRFNALLEKGERMPEEKIWKIFLQICMALHYMHQIKFIVHRDLTPSNVMLDWYDNVKITDFGLARRRNSKSSLMQSSVGTLVYSCPEVVKNEPYNDKADIWALACLLYQMAVLRPPFHSSNLLALAKRIAEANYPPVPAELGYSPLLARTVERCLKVDSDERPDIVEVCSFITPVLMKELDSLHRDVSKLERKLDRERAQRQRHASEAHRSLQNYRRLFLASQERVSSAMSMSDHPHGTPEHSEVPLNPPTLLPEGRSVNQFGAGDAETGEPLGALDAVFSPNHAARRRLKRTTSNPLISPGKPAIGPRPVPLPASASTVPSSPDRLGDVNPLAAAARARPSSPRPPRSPARTTQRSRLTSTTSEDEGSLASLPRTQSAERGRRPMSKHLSSNAVASITISSSKVREISDPMQQLLTQVHKLLFVSQLPPSLNFDADRYTLEKFKRSLFGRHTSPLRMKTELQKLQMGSKETVDMEAPATSIRIPSGESHRGRDSIQVTYEQLQALLEKVLLENGYYAITEEEA
eukprot:m.227055 g.227055  ORF g.227055 m.227055 type:complete len:1061 (-) comp22365_c1_seq7:18-3200(-)